MNSDFPLGGLLRFTKSYFLSHLILSRFLTAMFNSTYRITHNHRIGVQESRLANVRHVVLWVQLLTRYFESENALFSSFAARRSIHDVPPG